MRISVIGLPGSGKSTLARRVSEKLSIPHIHIDDIWFAAGGRNGSYDTPDIEAVRAYVSSQVQKAITQESWVSDGFYSRIQPSIAERADVVVFLDIPMWRRFLNHTSRMVLQSHRNTKIRLWDDIKFLPQIIRRTYTTGPKLRSFVSERSTKVTTLKNRKEVNDFLNTL